MVTPSQPIVGCGRLVVEMSNAAAVGTAFVPRPSTTPSQDAVEILGSGSFGVQEGAPVGWVAVAVGSGVASVNLSSGSAPVDSMAPISGIVVLVMRGDADLTGASVSGVSQSGATVATAPVAPASGTVGPAGCTTLPINPPTTVPPSTVPPTPVPDTTVPPATTHPPLPPSANSVTTTTTSTGG
jgi:hypothetical protein